MFPPLHLYSFQIIAKLIIIFFQLFKINKNIQDTLSLCVTRNGAKKLGTTCSCTYLLRTGGSPMSFMSFVNFSQFNLGFQEFRNRLFRYISQLRNSILRYEYYEKLTRSTKTRFRYVSLAMVLKFFFSLYMITLESTL